MSIQRQVCAALSLAQDSRPNFTRASAASGERWARRAAWGRAKHQRSKLWFFQGFPQIGFDRLGHPLFRPPDAPRQAHPTGERRPDPGFGPPGASDGERQRRHRCPWPASRFARSHQCCRNSSPGGIAAAAAKKGRIKPRWREQIAAQPHRTDSRCSGSRTRQILSYTRRQALYWAVRYVDSQPRKLGETFLRLFGKLQGKRWHGFFANRLEGRPFHQFQRSPESESRRWIQNRIRSTEE